MNWKSVLVFALIVAMVVLTAGAPHGLGGG